MPTKQQSQQNPTNSHKSTDTAKLSTPPSTTEMADDGIHEFHEHFFEKHRINKLQEERVHMQKKTFTKWMNSFLQKANMEVDDIFVDLADGKKLLKLLEIISGEKLGKPNQGKLRVQKIENVNKCLAFLHTKVKLESIGGEDIVDGNKTLILGLLWTIILRFQIQDIEIQLEEETEKKHSAKEALLLWCQRKTNGYRHANVADFTQSWRNGMAFNALIHSHRPELIDYDSLDPNNSIENLNNAFTVARDNLAIQPLLDAEDVAAQRPDEKSILTYVSSYYHTFAKYNSEVISGKRIANIISQLMEIDRLQLNYELYTTNLLNWIQMKIHELNSREFPNNLEQIQNEFIKFKEYRTVEKPPKYKERSEIEAILFNVQTKRKALGQVLYVPSEGKLVQDIHKSWVNLEKAEHKRELALREEMLRLEKINKMAESFYRKSNIRKGYLVEMIQVLSNPRYGNNLNQVEATIKKHEAISADILSRSERIDSLQQMVKELCTENYFDVKNVEQIYEDIGYLWKELLSLLDSRRNDLSLASNFMRTKQEIETIANELNEMNKRMNIDLNVGHLKAAEEYLQTHLLLEAQISSNEETVKRLNQSANKLLDNEKVKKTALLQKEIPNMKQSLNSLQKSNQVLKKNATIKREKLVRLRDFYRLMHDIEEEESALNEKLNICQAVLPGKDLLGIISLQQKHNVFETEVNSHEATIRKIENKAKNFLDSEKDLIEPKLKSLWDIWHQLQEMTKDKSKELSVVIEAFQHHADVNETESWLREKMQLAKSEDYGTNEQSAWSLLQRHKDLENEVLAYSQEIDRLNVQSDKMINADVESLFLLSNHSYSTSTDDIIEEVDGSCVMINNGCTPTMEEVAETVEIPQVFVLYNFKDKTTSMKKGESLILVEKTTPEWWKVCRHGQSTQMYVPSNYVKEIEPKITKVLTYKPVNNGKQHLQPNGNQLKTSKSSKIKRRPSTKRLSIASGTESVEQRKMLINSNYKKLVELCKNRRKLLEDSVKMFKFLNECDTFETWLADSEANINKSSVLYKEQQQQQNKSSAVLDDLSKQYGKMITDLLANRARLEGLDKMTKEINSTVYLSAAKKRKEQIQKKWDHVNFLQKQLGKNIEGLTSVEMFEAACNETLERINDKLEKITLYSDINQDLKTVQSLKRRHENLERELIPIHDSVNKLNVISENVKSSFPLEKSLVDKRLVELNNLWEELRMRSIEKRNWLDRMVGLQIVKNSSNDIIAWLTSYVKPIFQYDPKDTSFKNAQTIETITKEHNDLLVDIKGKGNDIDELKKLAQKLKNQVDHDELKIVDELAEKYQEIIQEWNSKTMFLKDCADVNAFNQEADRIDTMINSDLTFLEYDDTGSSSHDVLALIKRHETFLNTLNAQDQRVHNLIDFGDKLIQNGHFDSELIRNRQNKILQRRKMLKDKAYNRLKVLNDAKVYHEIKSNADEFCNWCILKHKLIKDHLEDIENIKSLANLKRKLEKHVKLTAEVRANKADLDRILHNLNDLNRNAKFVKANELDDIEKKVKNEWIDLNNFIEENDKLLKDIERQAEQKEALKLIQDRVDEIQNAITVQEPQIDRRVCKNLLQQNKTLEQELSSLENKLSDSNKMVDDDLKENPLENDFKQLKSTIDSLKEPLNQRKQRLLHLNEYHQFEFDVDAELQWIKDRITLVSTNDVPQNLTDAQNSIKKIEQNLKREVDAHECSVEKIMNKAEKMIRNDHPSTKEIQTKSNELKSSWENLKSLMLDRIEKLKLYLRIHQFLNDCAEIESWQNEKMNILNGPIYGNDELTLIKLLQKQKSIDLEIDTYAGLIDELSRQADKLSSAMDNESERKLLKIKAQELNACLKKMQKLASERNSNLIDLKQFHEYYRESNNFLDWIAKQKQTLLNEDYGKDYEYCIMLQSKFFDLKRLIMANEDRYEQCLENAKRFKRNDDDNRFQTNIDSIQMAWNDLMNLIVAKEQKFKAAVKIHRFNRDVADAFERMREKSTILNNQDYGRDCQSTKNLIRNHDLFENDLVALEAQLQVLINDSVKLKAEYTGQNAEHINDKLNSVVERWETLKNSSMSRKQRLCDTYDLYQFVSVARNLEQWALNLIQEIKLNEPQQQMANVDKAQNAKNLHEQIKSEIDAREDEFNILVKDANKLQTNPFYPEIKNTTEKLLNARDELYITWQSKNDSINQWLDFSIFMRDAKQMEQLCQQFRNRLEKLGDSGNTVEEVERNLKKFDEFCKLFASHEPKFNILNECATKLIEKNNDHSEEIKTKLKELMDKEAKLRQLILKGKEQLDDDLIYVQFKRDVTELNSWITEKKIQMKKLSPQNAGDNGKDDIEIGQKKYQKHLAFETEINANVPRITDIQNKTKHLISRNHPSSIEIRSQHDNLLNKWADLRTFARDISQGLEEAKDIYEFNQNIIEAEEWIRKKELMIQFNDTGEDYEHCEALLRKLDSAGIDEDKIQQINILANKLVNQCKDENQIDEKRQQLNEKWRQLQQKIADYRKRLNNALEIHSLNRDLDEVNERLSEKHLLASKECDAKNLPSVESAQRKHDTLCYDLFAIDNHLKTINENDARRLMAKNPEMMEKSRSKIQNIQENLRNLQQECNSKSKKLNFLIQMHKFFDLVKEYENWAMNMLTTKLSNESTAENVSQAKNELQDHEYLKAELIAKRENHQTLKEYGFELLHNLEQDKETNQSHIDKVNECIEKNEDLRKKLDQAWEEKNNYLKQCERLHKFNDLSKQCDSWLASNEAFLTNEDLGSNLTTVEELLKKHDSFVQSLAAQQRITDFSKFAEELIEMKHFDSQNIQIKLNETLERRDKLFESAKIRKQKLEDSKLYFNFSRNFNEIQRWLIEKQKVASDESYRDSINLLSKKQKHAAFEAEINSNKERIEDVIHEGETLINSQHFRSEDIKNHLATIEKLFRTLNETTTLKRNRLNEAYQALQFFRLCDVISLWIKDTETVLNDQDNGKDLTSVRNLLNKHQRLENDVHNHNESIEKIKDEMAHFQQNNHFQKEEIEERGKEVIKCFNDIQEPMNRRREILEEYLTFYQFKNDVEHEFFWIKEKESQLNQLDNANTVFDIQRLIKRHKMFESEIQTREPQLSALISKGHGLLKSECCNYEEIKLLTNDLQAKVQYIKDAFALKRMHLADSLESNQFYSDVAEAESWINEKMFLLNEDTGRDEESVSMVLKKVEAIDKETERFNMTTLAKLIQQSNHLLEKNHSESELIKQKAENFNEKFQNLQQTIEKKRQVLFEKNKYFLFEREADDLILWMKDQQIIANSEDYGQDVEHVESLIQQFDTFISYITSNEERIKSIEQEAKNVENSEEKLNEIKILWDKLKENINSRQETLQGALEVHRFYRSADETICWIREKESSTVLDEVNPNYDDVNSIKTKIHQLDGFEKDLNALREQVEILFVEADRLAESFPDIKDNIQERKSEVKNVWENLNMKTKLHKENLIQIENIQSYFDRYQELLTWINEMQALITADDKLVTDVVAAEQQLNRHKEYESEIKARNDNIVDFLSTGEKIIAQGHIMSKEIQQRNTRIKNLHESLLDTWKKRLTFYECNLDARQFIHDVDQMEKWISANHTYIDDNNFGDSIAEVEDLLKKHKEFEKTIQAQMEKLSAIDRITLMEKLFEKLRKEEQDKRDAELSRREKDRLLEEEQKKILYQRSNEEQSLYENLPSEKQSKISTPKTPRRIASFAFSRKTQAKPSNDHSLPPISIEGFLERKHLLQQGGKKAKSRSWKTYYTILSGHLLCFYKDKNALENHHHASPPLPISNARCFIAQDYKKKKYVFTIQLTDSSKYLFATSNDNKLREWMNVINFNAHLPQHKQLMGVDPIIPTVHNQIKQTSHESLSRNESDSSSSSRKSSLSSLPDHPDLNSSTHSHHPSTNGQSNSPDSEKYQSPELRGTVGMNKYASLPPNMQPIKEQKTFSSLKENSSASISSSLQNFDEEDSSISNEKKKPSKRLSFFKRNK